MTRLARALRGRLLLAAAVAALAGCRSHVRPYDPRPLPSPRRATAGGERLWVDADGALVRDHGVGDIAAALGVDLAQVGSAVVVDALRPGREGVGLAPGDVLLFAVPVAPWLPGPAPPEVEAIRRGGPLPAGPGPAGVPVRTLDDLRGLAVGVEGLAADLVVQRGQGRLVVRQVLGGPQAIAARPWSVARAAPLGAEVARLDDWPAERRPAGAGPDDLLVTRVARGSLAARAGLRPLDVIRGEGGLFALRMGDVPDDVPPDVLDRLRAARDWRQCTVVHADGREATVVLPEPEAPTDVSVPLLFAAQGDGLRWHFGLLPFDLLFHASGEVSHDPRTDTLAEHSRWSLLTVVQVQSIEGGGDDVTSVRLDPLADEPRLRYVGWLLDPAITQD